MKQQFATSTPYSYTTEFFPYHGEGSSVHEVPIEEEGVAGAWYTVERKYIHNIIKLPMSIPTHVEKIGLAQPSIFFLKPAENITKTYTKTQHQTTETTGV
jgi:hypothetical protein